MGAVSGGFYKIRKSQRHDPLPTHSLITLSLLRGDGGVIPYGEARTGKDGLHHLLIHARRRTEHARSHIRNVQQVECALNGAVLPIRTDRKSTRLNSSHVAISYAVCCLKKKK